MSGESDVEGNVHVNEQDQTGKVLSGKLRWMRRSCTLETALETCSMADASVDTTSRKSEIDNYSDRNSSTGSELSESAIHTLLVETRARDLDREVCYDPDSDRYLS